jgi:trehalose 6-phosphate phosphatase
VTVPLQGAAADAWRQLIDDPTTALLAFDFDGTLSPITEDPASAYAPPEVAAVLARLGPRVGQLAVVTGRPVQAVRRLGGFEGVDGLSSLVVLGQYGYERWDAATGRVVVPPPPDAITHVRADLPAVLEQHGWADAHVEEKGRALGVHLRRLSDPDGAFRALLAPLTALAEEHGLTVEPGKHVIEIRDDGMDKGIALRELVAEVEARTCCSPATTSETCRPSTRSPPCAPTGSPGSPSARSPENAPSWPTTPTSPSTGRPASSGC